MIYNGFNELNIWEVTRTHPSKSGTLALKSGLTRPSSAQRIFRGGFMGRCRDGLAPTKPRPAKKTQKKREGSNRTYGCGVVSFLPSLFCLLSFSLSLYFRVFLFVLFLLFSLSGFLALAILRECSAKITVWKGEYLRFPPGSAPNKLAASRNNDGRCK